MAEREIEEESCFFQRIGAMGDDDAVHIRPFSTAVDQIAQCDPPFFIHVVAVDVAHLDGLQVRERADGRHALQDVRDADPAGLIFRGLSGISAAGDGPAGGDDHDVFHGILLCHVHHLNIFRHSFQNHIRFFHFCCKASMVCYDINADRDP